MPPRRGGRDKNRIYEDLWLELTHFEEIIEVMEITQIREHDVGDINESKDTR